VRDIECLVAESSPRGRWRLRPATHKMCMLVRSDDEGDDGASEDLDAALRSLQAFTNKAGALHGLVGLIL
jgi:hypothetical protein